MLLLVATAISAILWAIERDAALPYEAIAILAVVLLNATMGYLQEARAEAAVAALRAMSAADATVVRGGRRQSVPAADVVAGDVMLVEEGDTIPADGRARRIGGAADRRSRADRRERAGGEGHGGDRRRRGARRSPQHGVQRHGRHLRAWAGGRDRDRHAHRDGPHRRPAEADARRSDAAAARARSHRQAPRPRRPGHRGCDDRHHPAGAGRARRRRHLRRADPGRRAGGRRGAGRPAGGGHGGAVDWRAADGAAQRHHPEPRGGRDAGLRDASSPRTRPAPSPRTR